MIQRRLWLVVVAAMAMAGCSTSTSTSTSAPTSPGKVGGDLTIWVDAARLPVAQAYAKAHPGVHANIVTFDGDGNGATTLQTKIQLWNRTGKGWPDVIFSEQVNDPVWMAQKPFDFAAPVKDLIPQDVLGKWPASSTAQCTINGTQYCVQDNLAQVVLWVNKKLMDQFHYTVPKTWQEWASLGDRVAKEHPGYIVGNIGDSFGHWIYLWGNQCPLEQVNGTAVRIDSTDSHCTRVAGLLDPLIKNGTVPPLSVFTPDFAQKYGGADNKVLLMPGPSWYAQAVFDQALHVPAKQITAAPPLQWGNETPVTTGQVGGGPWIMSRHSANLATAADFVTWATTVFNPSGTDTRPGYPAYAPLAAKWLEQQATSAYFAADPTPALKAAADQIWPGWNLVSYPDQPVWSTSVVTELVAGKPLSSLLEPFGKALKQAAQAAGYAVN
ncbi:ABC transporter substrate-binding protein [Amycolatopsis balhimycina]|uniref:ABC transporter substrate-binding protein n=1 Tax=Amycolatopsis balhimycina TaxID=208443 RepID=UPI001FE11C91|nr:ABC transporter substrate-binding protein [Amycolatopsis balhimycina]